MFFEEKDIYVTCLCDFYILFHHNNHIHSMSITISLHFCLGGLENELSHVGEGSYSLYHLACKSIINLKQGQLWRKIPHPLRSLMSFRLCCANPSDFDPQQNNPPKKQT